MGVASRAYNPALRTSAETSGTGVTCGSEGVGPERFDAAGAWNRPECEGTPRSIQTREAGIGCRARWPRVAVTNRLLPQQTRSGGPDVRGAMIPLEMPGCGKSAAPG